jgi:diguanylate cyclase (GGDEF)-like protein/PAS domain S-box-containing protein
MLYVIVSFATMAYFFYTAHNIVEQQQKEVLSLELESTRNQIHQNFLEIETVLSTVESQLAINSDEADLLNLITEIDKDYDSIASLYLGKPDKTMINSSGFIPGPDFDLTTRIWYQQAIENYRIIITPAFINHTQDRIIVTMAKAVYRNNVFIGVIAADIDIKTIINFVSEKKVGENGFSFIIDENNNVLAYPGLETEDIVIKSIAEFDPNLSLVSGSGSYRNFNLGDEEGYVYFDTIYPYDYTIGVFMPDSEFASSLSSMSSVFIYLSLILFVAAGFIAFIYNKRVKKPLDLLLNDIKSINISDSISYRLPQPKVDEYKRIRSSINNVLDATDFYFNENKLAKQQLLIENQRVKLLMDSTADIIFELNSENRYIAVFGKGLNLMGLKPSDFIGKTPEDIFGESGKSRSQVYKKTIAGSHSIFDWDYVFEDKVLHFESSISPIYNQNNQIIGVVDISRDITVPMQKQKEIEYISIHDFLTGLYNRRYFVEAFVEKDEESNYPLGVMMIDLNGLKILNDAYGHDNGDLALKKVAKVLREVTTETDIVCRIGGDEFSIISISTSKSDLEKMKDTIHSRLKNIYIKNVPLSVAIGFEMKNQKNMDFEEIMKNAENQMYRNKVTEGRSIRNRSIRAILKTLTDKFEEEKIHSTRVSELCKKMGTALNIKSDDLKELELAGLFHDIGKISIPDSILHKPGKLTEEEFEIVKTHTENGYNILRAADEYSNLAEYALSHHEYWNGKGYPRGLKGKETPLFSRIICIVDAYEAMTSDRVYRKAMSEDMAIKEIIRCSGTQFDPELARVFIEQVLGKKFVK